MASSDIDARIGRRISTVRIRRMQSQEEVASRIRRLGVNWSQGTLSKVENGERPVRLAEAPAVADALGISLDDLLERGSPVIRMIGQAWRNERDLRTKLRELTVEFDRSSQLRQFLQLVNEIRSGEATHYVVNGVDCHQFIDQLSFFRRSFSADGRPDDHSVADLFVEMGGTEDELRELESSSKEWFAALATNDQSMTFPSDMAWLEKLAGKPADRTFYSVLDGMLRARIEKLLSGYVTFVPEKRRYRDVPEFIWVEGIKRRPMPVLGSADGVEGEQ